MPDPNDKRRYTPAQGPRPGDVISQTYDPRTGKTATITIDSTGAPVVVDDDPAVPVRGKLIPARPSVPMFSIGGSLDLTPPRVDTAPRPVTPSAILPARPAPTIGARTITPTRETRTSKDAPSLSDAEILGMRPATNTAVYPSSSQFANRGASYGLLDNVGYDLADQARVNFLQKSKTPPVKIGAGLQKISDADARSRAENNALIRATRGEAGPAAAGLAVATLLGEAIPTPGGKGVGLLAKTIGKAALVGGGAMAGGTLFGNLQDRALRETLGEEGYAAYQERNRQSAEQFPEATFIGQQLPFAATMRPGRFTAQSIAPRLMGAATNAGIDAGSQLVNQAIARAQGQTPEPFSVGRNVGAGLVGGAFTGLNPLGEAIEAPFAAAGRGARPYVSRAGQAVKYAATTPPESRFLLADPFGIGAIADFAGRTVEGYRHAANEFDGRKTAPLESLLAPNGERLPFTLNPNWDAVENGRAPVQSFADPRTARAQKVRRVEPVTHPEIDSGVGGAGKNGVLLASAPGPINAMFNKAGERGHSRVMLSVGGRQMSVSNMDAAQNIVRETRHIVDNLKTATPGQVNRAIKDAARRFNGRDGITKTAPTDLRLGDLDGFLSGLSFSDRAAFLKLFASKRNAGAGVSPYWRDIVNAMNDPALVGKRANNGAAIGRLEEGGRALTAGEAGVPALKSYSHVGRGEFDGYLPELLNWRDMESVTPKTDVNGRLSPLAFQNRYPEVVPPVSYFERNYGVKARDISPQGVFNGIGRGANDINGGRPGGYGAGLGRPDVLSPGDFGRRDGVARPVDGIPGGRSRPGHASEPYASGGDGIVGRNQPDGNATGGSGGVSSETDVPSDSPGQGLARLRAAVTQPRRPAGVTDLSGNAPATAAYNREPNPAGGRGDKPGIGRELPSGPRDTTGAVSARQTESQTDLFGEELPPAAKAATKPPTIEKLRPEDIGVMDDVQFKRKIVDSANKVTDKLKNQTDFETDHAGHILVYRDLDGNNNVFHGHHRRELGLRAERFTTAAPDGGRMDAPRLMDAKVYDAKDGWTPESVKRLGVIANLRDGNADAIDAADALVGRGTPAELDAARAEVAKLPNSDLSKNTAGLIELDENGRSLVRNKKVTPDVAGAIGKVLAGDPERQKIALADAAKSKTLRDYNDGAKLATTVLYEPAATKDDGAQGGLFDGDFDSGYISTAGKQTEIEQSIRQSLLRAGSDLLRPTTATLREGETIDTAGRQAEAAQIADTRSKADALFSYDPQVRKSLRTNATRAEKGEITDAEAAANVQQIVQERGKLSVADIVKGAGTEGERARPAPLPVRKRETGPANGQPSVQTAPAKPKIEPVYGPDNPRPTMEQRRQALEASRKADGAQTFAEAVQPQAAPIAEDARPLTFRQRAAPAAVPLAPAKKGLFSRLPSPKGNPFVSKPRFDAEGNALSVPSWWDNVNTSRKMLLLSGPATHARNIKSNAGMQQMEEFVRGPASAADIVRVQIARGVGGQNTPLGRAIGTNRTTGGYSFGQYQKAVSEAVKKGLPEAWENFKTGAIKDGKFEGKVENGRFITDEKAASNLAKEALGSSGEFATKNELWNATINGIGRSLSSEDHVFKTFAWRRSIEEQAALIAREEKRADKSLPGDYVRTRSAELAKTPTDAMNEQAIVDAFVTTFNNENALNSVISDAKRKNKALGAAGDLILPFSKTPTNVILRALEHSGLGVVTGPVKAASLIKRDLAAERTLANERAAYKTRPTSEQAEKIQKAAQTVMDKNFSPAEQRAMAQAMGRGSIGAMAIGLGYWLSQNGYMTGKNVGQSDYKKREGANEPEGAIYIPPVPGVKGGFFADEKWATVSDDVPLGAMLVLGATIRERQGAGVPPVQGALGAVAGQINDIPALSASDQIRDFADIKNVGKFAGGGVGSFVPALGANVAAQMDSKKRKQGADKDAGPVQSFLQQLYRPTFARVPGLRQTLPENGERLFSPFDPFKTQPGAKSDPDLFKKVERPQYTGGGSRGGGSMFGGDESEGRRRGRGRRRRGSDD